ncbi:MAG: hypothetical protein IJ341_01955 [Bacteroidales bacterium]|nr:hypothetical protein [Bacteroidales bacterium]
MFELDSQFIKHGNDITEFFDALRELQDITKIEVVNTRDIHFSHVVNSDDDVDAIAFCGNFLLNQKGSQIFEYVGTLVSSTKEKGAMFLAYTVNGDSVKPKTLSKDNKIYAIGWSDKLIKEVENDSGMIIVANNKTMACSPLAVPSILARADLAGNIVAENSYMRTIFIAWSLLRKKPKKVTFVTRNVGKARVLVAMHSEKYAYIPQMTLKDIYDTLCDVMGDVRCLRWEITHGLSSCYVEFPTIGKEFSDAYDLKHEVVPGLSFCTSDTGISSLSVTGFWRIGTHIIGSESLRCVHKGNIDIKKLISDADKDIFSKYRTVPSRLCDLLTIDCPTPSDTIKSVAKEIDLVSIIGSKRARVVVEALCAELTTGVNYTAYDIATMFASLPERCFGLDKHRLEHLRGCCKKALFADYNNTSASTPFFVGA